MTSQLEVWQNAPEKLSFPDERIDVWRVHVDSDSPTGEELEQILTADEIARAARFHFERDRNRYTRGRSALRLILSRYLLIPPEEIRFQYELHGKPRLVYPQSPVELQFNASGSGGLALIAVGSGSPIGVDIEKLRATPDLVDVTKRFFSVYELHGILGLSVEKRQEAFFACWTRKEAYLKALGLGLSYPLSDFSVSTDPDSVAEIREIKGEENFTPQWSLTDIFPWEGFRGALAREGVRCRVSRWIFLPGY